MQPSPVPHLSASPGQDAAEKAVQLFVERLVAIAPDVATAQGARLPRMQKNFAAALKTTLGLIRDEVRQREILHSLGRHHGREDIEPAHVQIMGAALLWAIWKVVSTEMPAPVQDAWGEFYGSLCTMIAEERAPSQS
jgi:hemoglobin-like flavoprotein